MGLGRMQMLATVSVRAAAHRYKDCITDDGLFLGAVNALNLEGDGTILILARHHLEGV